MFTLPVFCLFDLLPYRTRQSRVTIPGGVQEAFRCGTKEHGLVGIICGRWTVGLDDLGDFFSNPDDCVIL